MKPHTAYRPAGAAQQRGAILVTSLLLLLVLTVLGVAMMRMTNVQERMSGNTRDVNLALQGAEAGLRGGERVIDPFVSSAPLDPSTSASGCMVCQPGTLPLAMEDPNKFDWNAEGHEFGTAGVLDIPGLAEDPRFAIEEIAFIENNKLNGQEYYEDGRLFFQITSRSTGASGLANVVLQSTFARPK
jgi:type IV pilus assembly protein PilX